MRPNANDFTWQSLYEYIERKIVEGQNALQRIQKDTSMSNLAESTTSLGHQLDLLRWCLPLVKEMQSREDMQVICPKMSLEIIRLRCRHVQVSSPDFAWIVPVADDQFTLKQINPREPEKEWLFEGNLGQIVEEVNKLVKEICV